MYFGNIKEYDIANGEGIRISLFVSGCTNRCPGCFQPETWSFTYGRPYTEKEEQRIIDFLKNDYVDGLSLLGGEPMEPENQRELVRLCRCVKKECPGKTIWCYTGFLLENLLPEGRVPRESKRCEVTDELLSYIDVLVDGPYVEEKKNISLPFCGSENQRVIDLQKTLRDGRIIQI